MNSRINLPTRELQTVSVYFDQLHTYYETFHGLGIEVRQRALAVELHKIMNGGGIMHLVTDVDPIRFELHNIANFDTLTAYRMEGALATVVRHEQTMDFPILFRVELFRNSFSVARKRGTMMS
jgi:hypothetical protein